MTDNHVPPHLTIMSVEAREEEKIDRGDGNGWRGP